MKASTSGNAIRRRPITRPRRKSGCTFRPRRSNTATKPRLASTRNLKHKDSLQSMDKSRTKCQVRRPKMTSPPRTNSKCNKPAPSNSYKFPSSNSGPSRQRGSSEAARALFNSQSIFRGSLALSKRGSCRSTHLS